jgi:PadR family transcriptional regulator, regulatory protein PadR
MPSQANRNEKSTVLQGTLDLLILQTLVLGSRHGQGIARSIQQQSEDVFLVDHGSLYLALQRLEEKGWVSGKWGVSENNRKARFYALTAKGRDQLTQKADQWRKVARAIGLILGPEKVGA